ncbi:MAG: AmmeMemoRadiSam system protein A [Nitrospirae bacterium]|nr:AmmeMemoRadiSam system protein A [Nitrospirota bacterium]
MHVLVKLAKEAVEIFVKEGVIIPAPSELTPEMSEKAGVFVSIKKKGELRGCIGTYSPSTHNVACEIIQNSISAAAHDPRFAPVGTSELKDLEYSVDVLSAPERVSGPADLDPKRYGVIVKKGDRRGLLLPDLEGVNTVKEQIEIAAHKAGIYGDDVELYRFEVRRCRQFDR